MFLGYILVNKYIIFYGLNDFGSIVKVVIVGCLFDIWYLFVFWLMVNSYIVMLIFDDSYMVNSFDYVGMLFVILLICNLIY